MPHSATALTRRCRSKVAARAPLPSEDWNMTRMPHARGILVHATVALFLFSVVCGRTEEPASKNGGTRTALTVTSSAFASGGADPFKYTCEGANVSPPLSWTGAPAGAKSLALICDDPDAPAGTWVHWVLYNLPSGTTSLAEKIEGTSTLSNGAMQGMNDFDKIGLWRAVSAARQAASLLLQALRPRYRSGLEARRHEENGGASDGASHPGRGAVHGRLSAQEVIPAARSKPTANQVISPFVMKPRQHSD